MIWSCHHGFSQGTQWGGLLASLLHYSSNNMSPRCLPNMPWVLLRWVFSFRIEPHTNLLCWGVWYSVCFLLSGSPVAAIFTIWDSTTRVCTAATLWSIPLAGICASCGWSMIHTRSAQSGCSFHYFELEEASCYSFSCPPAISSTWWAYRFEHSAESPNPYILPIWQGGVFSSGLCSTWWHGWLWISVGIKPGDSGVVIGYQVDEFTHTWLMECFIAQ